VTWPAGPLQWIAVGATVVLAAGIGLVAGVFLLSPRSAGMGPASAYVPADAAFYVEWRAIPSEAQDAALREILARFPIPGFEADRPLVDQLTDMLDEELASEGLDVSWSEDVAPWFDGRVAMAITDTAALDAPTDPMDVPSDAPSHLPSGVLLMVGVRDADAARVAVDRLVDASGGSEPTSTEHSGVTIWTLADEETNGSYAITTDSLIFGRSGEDIAAAIDSRDVGSGGLGANEEIGRLTAALPQDWLVLAVANGEAMLAQVGAELETQAPEMTALFELMGDQSLTSVTAISAFTDRLIVDAASTAPTGDFAVENSERGLAGQVPDDALFFADGGNVGPPLARFVEALRAALGDAPEVSEGVEQLEAALGAELHELVAWIDDAAIVGGWDGEQPYGGLILIPSDADEARRRIDSLLTVAHLATLDPSSGIAISEETVSGTEVTTIGFELPGVGLDSGAFAPSLALQVAVGDARVVIGLGDRFVRTVLELDAAESLGADERYAATITDLGGDENVATAWVDLAGIREAAEGALDGAGMLDGAFDYEADVRPWLLPLDRVASVSRLEGDLLIQHAVLVVE
jgi:hypothetical protein